MTKGSKSTSWYTLTSENLDTIELKNKNNIEDMENTESVEDIDIKENDFSDISLERQKNNDEEYHWEKM